MQALSQMDAVARFPGTKALPSLNPEDRLASSPLLALPKRDRRNSGQGQGGAGPDETLHATASKSRSR
jgi:hypothetical protein